MIVLILAALTFIGLLYVFVVPDTPGFRLIIGGVALTFIGSLVFHGAARTVTASTALPANPTMILTTNAQKQETLLNAQVYPVAIVSLADTAALTRLNALYTAPASGPHRLGFLAVVDPQALSAAQAVAATQKVMTAHHMALPWAVVLDPPGAYEHPGVQLYWATGQTIHHVTGASLWSTWAHLTRPIALTPFKLVPTHTATSASHKKTGKTTAAAPAKKK